MLAIVDYNAGNLTSVKLAIQHVGGNPIITKDPDIIRKADRVIFPGVGAAASCMKNLKELGLDNSIIDFVASGKPILAICIGIQLLFSHTEENDGVDCLGILSGKVKRFSFPLDNPQKIPHMGWNSIKTKKNHQIFEDIEDGNEFYFVHSYYIEPTDKDIILTETEYGGKTFVSSIAKDNLIATQFHPEKSGKFGLNILKHFINQQ